MAFRACCSASGLPDENAHAPNEKLDLGNFHGGVIASAHLYEEIAQLRALSMFDVMDRLERFYGPQSAAAR